ncbi:MAG: MarR family transcriptional regulator [Oscillospiraceae bacterium]|nr:MarR family transcriptional regulator [Oscillospiraceae bacterium]
MRYSYRYVLNPLMENESLTQLELVRITGQKPPTISITLRNMEREGIVERAKNGGDKRETHVSLTEKGKKMYAKVLASLEKMEKVVLKGISEKELNAMSSTVEKMKKNIETALK